MPTARTVAALVRKAVANQRLYQNNADSERAQLVAELAQAKAALTAAEAKLNGIETRVNAIERR